MIWVVGGTVNATDICKSLVSAGYPVLVSVTTGYGRDLSEITGAEVLIGNFIEEEMIRLISNRHVKLVVDASHPFAAEVSKNAIRAAQAAKVPYLRFERPIIEFSNAQYVNNYQDACDYLSNTAGNILLTIGVKNINQFTSLGFERLYVRVLSSSESMTLCEKAGIKPSHIIGQSGVCSVRLNQSFLQEFNIRYLVTKDSGAEGGLPEKVEAAQNTGTKVIVIQRPAISYPQVFGDYSTLMTQIEKICCIHKK